MRVEDRRECAAFGHSPKQALRDGLNASTICLTALVDGKPEAMMGLVVVSAIEGLGRPWMLGTDEIFRHGRELIAWGPGILSGMFDSTPRMSNLVSSTNARAIRLLRRWGFAVEEQEEMIGGVAFRKFWMGAGPCAIR